MHTYHTEVYVPKYILTCTTDMYMHRQNVYMDVYAKHLYGNM